MSRRSRNLIPYIAFTAGGIFFVYLGGLHLSIPRQFVLGWGLLAILIVLKRAEFSKGVPWRFFFIFTAAFISMRYWLWRTFDTLIYTGPLDFAAMMLLYAAETYAITIHLTGMFISAWPLKRKSVPLPDAPELLPTVDVLIPTYNEPEGLVRVTVTAAAQIDYPADKLRIHLLDDGSTVARRSAPATSRDARQRYDVFKRMAGDLGINYIAREANDHAKAGNINHALKHTDGDLLLVLDCDHVPTRDILRKTVGCFLKDKLLAIVQTPHFFINPDPVEKNISSSAFVVVPGENEMFYCGMQPGMDMWNSSFFCGSAAVLRRSHIEEVSGLCVDTITEDAATSLYLHAKGYNSLYLDTPLVCGLSPETFEDFIAQRRRWAQGMLQILLLKFPSLAGRLGLHQSICYFNSCFFWLFGFSRLIFYLAPAAFLLFGLEVYHASVLQVLAYAGPHILVSFVLMDFLYGRFRWPMFSELYESVQSIFLIPSVAAVFRNPRAPVFKVTPKGESLHADSLSRHAIPFYVMLFIAFTAVPVAVVKWFTNPLYRDVIVITFSWSVFNLFMALASLGTFWHRRQVRVHHRAQARGRAEAFFPRLDLQVEGEIKDVSVTGIGMDLPLDFEPAGEEEAWIEARDSYGENYRFRAKMRRHAKKKDVFLCGFEFEPDRESYPQRVRFVYGDSRRWAEWWSGKSHSPTMYHLNLYFLHMVFKGCRESVVGLREIVRDLRAPSVSAR